MARASVTLAAGSVNEALRWGERALRAAGCESPRLDAELLLARALGVDRARLVTGARDPLAPAAREDYRAMVARRIAREPVAYIAGRRAFRRLTLDVDRRVLIPRPESELLVEAGLTLPRGARVVDVGTGSGAVALALKDERPDLAVTGTDLSADALEVARLNAGRLGLEVRWARADLLDEQPYDAALANLPYVADGEALAPEIAAWEPAAALYAGPDGLEQIRRLIARVTPRAAISLLALEVGAGQAGEVSALLADAGAWSVQRLRDLAGHERVVVGRR